MANTPPNLVAGGDIAPSRFVTLDASNPHTALQAGANAALIGISHEGSNYPPLSDLVSTALHAKAGQPVGLYGDGDVCLVQAGGDIVTGQRLKADTDGKAVAIATTGTTIQECGAIALEAGASGNLVKVQVQLARILPAAS